MAKYSLEFKLEVVKKFIAGESLPKLKGVQDKTILRYAQSRAKIYKEFDKNILDPKIIYRTYTLAEKIKACKEIIKGKSMRQVARELGMESHGTVRRWYNDYIKHGIAGLQYRKGIKPITSVKETKPMKKPLTKDEREELISLGKRNEILEAENDFLKKLNALVSSKEGKDTKAK